MNVSPLYFTHAQKLERALGRQSREQPDMCPLNIHS